MKTKIVRAYLQGGLGNQCFIYATARAIALKASAGLVLDEDYLADDHVYRRKLELDQFACAFGETKACNRFVRTAKRLRYRIVRNFPTACAADGVDVETCVRLGNYCWDGRPYRFRQLPTMWTGTLTLDGYWQSEKYFIDIREQLLADFKLKTDGWIENDNVARAILSTVSSVFLHIRTYKEVPGASDGRCARRLLDYYHRAIDYIVEHVEKPVFFVFSDDVAFARDLLSPVFGAVERRVPAFSIKVLYVEPIAMAPGRGMFPSCQIRDFMLMRMCKHGIVADSSFSWWAGWLGEQERRIKGEHPIRIRVNQVVMNKDFWPERWIAV